MHGVHIFSKQEGGRKLGNGARENLRRDQRKEEYESCEVKGSKGAQRVTVSATDSKMPYRRVVP